MTKEELKILLRDFRNMQAQLNYLKELSNDQTISQTTFHEKEELKILLRDFRNMQAQLNYLKELSNDQTISQTTFHEKERMLRLIESALTVLDKRERFVIETHLMNQETWTETSRKLQDCFGMECLRSDRTLKRIQNRALEKIITFMEEVSI